MAVSKRLRYEVLRRDNHQCRYCGASAPDTALTVDHVLPVALGGDDKSSNLVTACVACNSGKSSSNPDAPIVEDVAQDALRWSRAIAQAAEIMRAQLAERQDIHEQIDKWWNEWNYGTDELEVPRPPDWRESIDNFLAAGLPLEVLGWCIRLAMMSRASPDSTWRYMCGVAWRKVADLQECGRSIADGGGDKEGASF